MSSVSAAHLMTRDLGDLLAPELPGKIKLDRLYRALQKRLPDMSRRYVRALFFAEVTRVDYDVMIALKELRAEEELKSARRQLAASANILAAHHAAYRTPLDSDSVFALGQLAGLVDLPRNGGAAR